MQNRLIKLYKLTNFTCVFLEGSYDSLPLRLKTKKMIEYRNIEVDK